MTEYLTKQKIVKTFKPLKVEGSDYKWKAGVLYAMRSNWFDWFYGFPSNYFKPYWKIEKEIIEEIKEFENTYNVSYENLKTEIPTYMVKTEGDSSWTKAIILVKRGLKRGRVRS